MHISVVENVLKLNDELAADNRKSLHDHRIFTVNLIGAPGCGKTSLLEATARMLRGKIRLAIIVGDLTTQRDADRMAKYCDDVVQVNTGKGCHLEANHIRNAMANMSLNNIDMLIIENVGNLICPVGFDLGQDIKIGMFSAAEGDDKPAKHPYIVKEAGLLLLNKIDLLPYVSFNKDVFLSDIRRIKPDASVMEISATRSDNMNLWAQWLMQQMPKPPANCG